MPPWYIDIKAGMTVYVKRTNGEDLVEGPAIILDVGHTHYVPGGGGVWRCRVQPLDGKYPEQFAFLENIELIEAQLYNNLSAADIGQLAFLRTAASAGVVIFSRELNGGPARYCVVVTEPGNEANASVFNVEPSLSGARLAFDLSVYLLKILTAIGLEPFFYSVHDREWMPLNVSHQEDYRPCLSEVRLQDVSLHFGNLSEQVILKAGKHLYPEPEPQSLYPTS